MTDIRCRHAEMYHSNGIHFPTKTMTMFGEVNEENCEKWMKNLHLLDPLEGSITIRMNSEGGCVIQAKALFDTISNCKSFVKIIVSGQASSSASLILQAADYRVLTPNSHIMIHIGEETYGTDNPKNIKRWIKYNELTSDWMEQVYLRRIKHVDPDYTVQKVRRLLQYDTILPPQTAIDLGLSDSTGEA